MTDALPVTPPGFDQPTAMLKHCHDRIRKQLATLVRLLDHLPEHGADAQAREAAAAVIKYFEQAAPFHHADEEENLLPMLKATARGADLALLDELAPDILRDHDQMDALWQDLHEQLAAIATGSALLLSAANVRQFNERYLDHMEREETFIAPMAKRLFSAPQMVQLGEAMQRRRGITPAGDAHGAAAAGVAGGASGAVSAAGAPALGAAGAPPIGEAVAALRTDYGRATLDEADVAADPIIQFTAWFEQALAAQVNEPNAMGLSTVDAHGKPSSRIVLVKQFDARGFTWYTNYDSQKGHQLCANPHAALLFFWSELERQVRIEGTVERTSAADSDHYFHSRPLKSRLAAIASVQSAPIDSRAALEQHYDAAAAQWGDTPPRPAHWGGFRLVPTRIEFWQGRRSRFHDRVVYTLRDDGSWTRQRLQP